MPHNRGTRHNPKWVGFTDYKGHRKWVGMYASMEAYKAAEERCQAELREAIDNPSRDEIPTVLEFAGAVIDDNGRITMTWQGATGPEGDRP